MSSPVLFWISSSAAAISATGSYIPVYVTPMIATTPIVFSSTYFARSCPSSVLCSALIGTYRGSTSK